MSIKIQGDGGTNVEVDSGKRLLVNVATDADEAGFATLVTESDPGAVMGSRDIIIPEATADHSLRITGDNLVGWHIFNGAAIQTNIHVQQLTTFTTTQSGGVVVINSGNSTTASAIGRLTSYRHFRVLGGTTTYVQFRLRTINGYVANKTIEVGAGFATGTTAPTDGVYFRWTPTGDLRCIVNVNGVEQETIVSNASTNYADNTIHTYLIEWAHTQVKFWIDSVQVSEIATPANTPGATLTLSYPVTMRVYNAGVAPPSAPRLEVASWQVFESGSNTARRDELVACLNSRNSIHGFEGATTIGQSAQWANSSEPSNATLSNTAAGYATLGGTFAFAAPAGAATDYALFGYLVETATATRPAPNLVISGVRIAAVNQGAAVATTATIVHWAIAVGSTAVSLATTDSSTARGPKRLPLGIQSWVVGAAIGVAANDIFVPFGAPLVCEPGCYVHIICRVPVGTATASQIIRGVVMINAHWD
jgi:hypothetical protein